MQLKFLFFGDIMGKIGRKALAEIIPTLDKKYHPDFVLANGENLAHGNGISPETLAETISAGVEFFTSGNHVFNSNPESIHLLEANDPKIIRPANYPEGTPGQGYVIVEIKKHLVAIINLIGRVGMPYAYDCPFRALDKITKELDAKNIKIRILDFHAETTSEKMALGLYSDGKTSLTVGTHTHITTADAQILPLGTGYISDLGMVGEKYSVLGLNAKGIIDSYIEQLPPKREIASSGTCLINGVFAVIDTETNHCTKIELVQTETEVD